MDDGIQSVYYCFCVWPFEGPCFKGVVSFKKRKIRTIFSIANIKCMNAVNIIKAQGISDVLLFET
jgi:hypothetical protein